MSAAGEAMAPAVFACNGVVRADSLDIAKAFGKRHADVMRAIDNLTEMKPSLTPTQFCAGVYMAPETGPQQHRHYLMDRDGFALLVMGFTGKQALDWKLAYIEAFNAMEAELRAGPMGISVFEDRASAEFIEHRRTALMMVREARAIYGRAGARRAWAIAGLPDVEAPSDLRIEAAVNRTIAAWFAARMRVSPGARTEARALYDDFLNWCRREGRTAVSQTAFGCALRGMGVMKQRAASGRKEYLGIGFAGAEGDG